MKGRIESTQPATNNSPDGSKVVDAFAEKNLENGVDN